METTDIPTFDINFHLLESKEKSKPQWPRRLALSQGLPPSGNPSSADIMLFHTLWVISVVTQRTQASSPSNALRNAGARSKFSVTPDGNNA